MMEWLQWEGHITMNFLVGCFMTAVGLLGLGLSAILLLRFNPITMRILDARDHKS